MRSEVDDWDSEIIIVGGGPAGAACAWKLRQYGRECLILDKQSFPRTKLCAGWITPDVFERLGIRVEEYPNSLTRFDQFHVHLFGREMILRVRQYAIRRIEFDHWLVNRAGVPVRTHQVKEIRRNGEYYIIDGQYRCRYLVGAGGSHCPVYRTFFQQIKPRVKEQLVATIEEEFPYDVQDANCHLWFFENNLPGYAWYVPKSSGHLNIGIGGYLSKLKAHDDTINQQWQLYTRELERRALVKNHSFEGKGSVYYIRNDMEAVQIDRLFLVGDAAGLATKDMGEGIDPAIASGTLAADAIVTNKDYSLRFVKKFSFPRYRTAAVLMWNYLFQHRRMNVL